MFYFRELEIIFPELGRIGVLEVGAQDVAPFTSPGDTQGGAVKLPTQGGFLRGSLAVEFDADFDEACIASGFFLGGTKGLMHGVA